MIKRALLDHRALTKPSTVQAVILATCLLLVVHKLRDGTQKAPSRVLGRMHLSATAMTLVEHLNLLEGTFIGKAH